MGIMIGLWLTLLGEILLSIRGAESAAPLIEDNAARSSDTVFSSNLINTIFNLRVLFRRAATATLFTIGWTKRHDLSRAVVHFVHSLVKTPHAPIREKGPRQTWTGLTVANLYSVITVSVIWLERIVFNWNYLTGVNPSVVLINPIKSYHWAIGSGALMTLGEYGAALLVGLSVTVLWVLRLHLDAFSRSCRMVALQVEFRLWSISSPFLPLYFQMTFYVMMRSYWLNQTSFILIPAMLSGSLLAASEYNMRQSREASASLQRTIAVMVIVELESMSGKVDHESLRAADSFEVMLNSLHSRPMSVELGIITFVDTKTFAAITNTTSSLATFLNSTGSCISQLS
ncbi:hypothetical protein BV898_06886 [Hypsibius exemplaris]|uniref:VWFA domain-containing protein n=1 Tax=Hypsibius exemplaris TaxID=2072580 RepID=A0A1W0WV27_HYPEX|nr:hypothetical protein BV898_06886 [Hypsibius exemplaris]